LSDALRLLPQQLHAEAYTGDGQVLHLELFFCDPANSASTQIFAPQPNPTAGAVCIPLQLESEQAVSLEVYDAAGRLVYREDRRLDGGLQWLPVPAEALGCAGVYGWRMQAGAVVRAGKLLRL